jgi:XTP/dITP diphosphohydrolase
MDVVGSWPDVQLNHFRYSIKEPQTLDLESLIEEKAIAAFACVRHLVIVDHTCLALGALKGLPGSMTSAFWEAVGTDVCNIVSKLGDDTAEILVSLAFTDGRQIQRVIKRQKGTIAKAPRGSRNFDWDRVFVPRKETRTYAEMSPREKNQTSPRAKAFEDLIKKIRKQW